MPDLLQENSNNKNLTPDKLRTYPGLGHLSDEEATNAIHSLEILSIILLENNHNEQRP